jgi:ribosomal protein S14
MTTEELQQLQNKQNKETATEDGKCFGECESCGQETVLVEEVNLCGPCCFGEADTINGNW